MASSQTTNLVKEVGATTSYLYITKLYNYLLCRVCIMQKLHNRKVK